MLQTDILMELPCGTTATVKAAKNVSVDYASGQDVADRQERSL